MTPTHHHIYFQNQFPKIYWKFHFGVGDPINNSIFSLLATARAVEFQYAAETESGPALGGEDQPGLAPDRDPTVRTDWAIVPQTGLPFIVENLD